MKLLEYGLGTNSTYGKPANNSVSGSEFCSGYKARLESCGMESLSQSLFSTVYANRRRRKGYLD